MGAGPGPSTRGDGPRGGGGQFSERGGGNFSADRRGGGRQWHRGHRGPGVAFGFGAGYPYGYGYDDYDYGYGYGAYAYAEPACELVQVRYVRPNGRVAYRTVERCY